MRKPHYVCIISIFIFTIIFLSGCVKSSEYCSPSEYIDLSNADIYADNLDLPFCFPVDNLTSDQLLNGGIFASYTYISLSPDVKKYHAAEDYYQPAGSCVYAMADGFISFSGPMGGYGWLVIIDHPEINLYSLYGHLSPSRWRIKSGTVQKGQLIAYLGDPDENGGSKENPLRPHLHFGIRSGQRADYPTTGEWRWQAGWIKYCPQDLGWLQPSLIINAQEIPEAGFQNPDSPILEIWWLEIVFSVIVMIGAIIGFIFTAFRGNKVILISFSILLPLATWYFFYREYKVSYALLVLCIIFIVIRSYKLIYLKRRGIKHK